MIDVKSFDSAKMRSEVFQLSSHFVSCHGYSCANSSIKSDENDGSCQPFKGCNLTIWFLKFNKLMSLGLWVEMAKFVLSDDAAQKLFGISACWRPLDVSWFRFNNETVVRSISLMVGNCQHLIRWAGYEVSFNTPVTICDLLTVLGNAWNFSLTLTIKESQTTLFSTNRKNWVCFRPWNIGGNIFLWCQFNILELSLTHTPNRDNMRSCQNGQRIIILVPLHVIDVRVLVAWEFQDRFSLSIRFEFVKCV